MRLRCEEQAKRPYRVFLPGPSRSAPSCVIRVVARTTFEYESLAGCLELFASERHLQAQVAQHGARWWASANKHRCWPTLWRGRNDTAVEIRFSATDPCHTLRAYRPDDIEIQQARPSAGPLLRYLHFFDDSINPPWPLERCRVSLASLCWRINRHFDHRISVCQRARRASRRRLSTHSLAKVCPTRRVYALCISTRSIWPIDWYDIKAPSIFEVRNVGKTLVNRSQGLSV